MIRYILSLLIFTGGAYFAVYQMQAAVWSFIDIPVFVNVMVIPFLFVSVLYGFTDMKAAFSSAFKKDIDRAALQKALVFFGALGKAVWITGIMTVIIGATRILRSLDDAILIAPNAALAILPLCYCCIAYAVLVIPFTVLIQKKLKEIP